MHYFQLWCIISAVTCFILLSYLYFYFYFFDFLHICSVVIMEGDPHPGAAKGRMSFQSFNPLVDVSLKIKNFKAVSLLSYLI